MGVVSAVMYPAPEFTSRDEVPEGVVAPAVVVALAAEAVHAGWAVRTQISRGRKPHSTTGAPLALRTYFAVRMAHGSGRAAYAVYDGTTWCDVAMWGGGVPPFPYGGVTDLRRFLAAPEACGMEWFDAIRERVAGQEARAKQRLACNAGRHDDVVVQAGGRLCRTCENSWPFEEDPWKAPRKGTGEGR